MSFDARSKERLEALGRTLPKKLPLPEPTPSPQASEAQGLGRGQSGPFGARAQKPGSPVMEAEGQGVQGARNTRLPRETPRHRLEREQDPAELFRALITASPDGSVPPHLLDRLRDLETPRPPAAAPATGQPAGTRPATSGRPAPNTMAAPRAPGKGPKGTTATGQRSGSRTLGQGRASEDQDLYTAFAQLLLEDDGD